MANILIVEDDVAINMLVRKSLELVGHRCTPIFDGALVREVLANEQIDLILLDIMLPNLDGFQIMAQLEVDIPVIFLTARDRIDDKVRGLNLGAYDYLVKPFEMLELQARVEAVLRRTKKDEHHFVLGDVKVDFTSRKVWLKDALVELTHQEFNLVEVLVKNRNIALSREKLLELAWGYDYMGEARTVDVHIHPIRKKLGWEHVIKTVYKLGYRLEVPK